MGDILFLAHRVPFPPDRGDKIRSHHLLKALARLAPVHVGTFAETAQDRAQDSGLRQVAASYRIVHRAKPLALAGVEALLNGKPVSLTAFDSPALRRWVAETIACHDITTIFVFSGQMGQYVPAGFTGRVVVDLCDVDSAKFDAYAAAGQRPWLNAREGRRLAAEEARLAARADCTLLISDEEAALLRQRMGQVAGTDIRALGNGIDTARFDPAQVAPESELCHAQGPQLLFTGQMDYAPNVEACLWAARELIGRIREEHPGACFHIVGRNPVKALRDLDRAGGVRVWGEVPDTRPFLAAADIVLVPLQIARGVQNKVLEAMAMARPVLATPEAATGIGGRSGRELLIEPRDGEAMAARITALHADPDRRRAIGDDARRFVIAQRSWEAMLAPLATIVGHEGATRDAA